MEEWLRKEYAAHVGEIFLKSYEGIYAFETIGQFFFHAKVMMFSDHLFTIDQVYEEDLKKEMKKSFLSTVELNMKEEAVNEMIEYHLKEIKEEPFTAFILLGMEQEKNKQKWKKQRMKRVLK